MKALQLAGGRVVGNQWWLWRGSKVVVSAPGDAWCGGCCPAQCPHVSALLCQEGGVPAHARAGRLSHMACMQ